MKMRLLPDVILQLYLLTVFVPAALYAEDTQVIFFAIQLESASEIPDDCQSDMLLPTTALTGYTVDWDYLCSISYYDKCEQVLDYIFRLQYTQQEKEFITGIIKAFTDLGASFTCNKTEAAIAEVMSNGGQQCINDNITAIYYCSYVSILKFVSGQYQENVCRTLDLAYDCYMKTVNGCNATALSEMWTSYYNKVIEQSPCNKYSKYGGHALSIHSCQNFVCILTFVAFISNWLYIAFIQALL